MFTAAERSRRRAALLPLIGLMATALSGCFVLSVNPLYDDEDLVFDGGLVGVWGEPSGGDKETWQFLDNGDGAYRLVIREDDSLRIRPESDGLFVARLLDLSGQRFLDLYPEEPATGNDFYKSHIVPAHSFWKVRRDGDVLALFLLDRGALETMAENQDVRLDHVEHDGVTVLTEPTARLREVLGQHIDALFPDSETLRRIQ